MKILNFEDDIVKFAALSRCLKGYDLQHVRCIDDGLELLKHNKYDLIITDMNFPVHPGDRSTGNAGEIIIEHIKGDIPIILFSSVNYKIHEIFGTVHYSDYKDWETDLIKLIKQLENKEG